MTAGWRSEARARLDSWDASDAQIEADAARALDALDAVLALPRASELGNGSSDQAFLAAYSAGWDACREAVAQIIDAGTVRAIEADA